MTCNPDPTSQVEGDPLDIRQPCGCPIGQGHVCPPPWVTDEEWYGETGVSE